MHARHAGGFFYDLVKYVTRSLQSPFDDPNLAAFSKEWTKKALLSISDPDARKRISGSDPAPNQLIPDGVEGNDWSSPKL